MKTFEKEVLSLELIEVVGVDDEYSITEDVSKNCTDDQRSPAVSVRPGPSKKGKNARENGLNNTVVGLQRRHILLNLDLLIFVFLNVVANLFREVQIDFADLVNVQVFGHNNVKPKI